MRATSAAFRSDLNNLDSFMSSCNSNIETFSTHVNHAVASLQARGERVDDLLTNLFKGYKIASDAEILASIDLWESNWMHGDDLTPELLMTKSLKDYNMKVLWKTWGQHSDDQRSIMYLTAELQTIKDLNIQLSVSGLRNIQKKDTPGTSGTKRYNPIDPKYAWRSFRGEQTPTTLNMFNNTYN